nr:permease [Saccharopolyspora sp. HNM0983]
MRTGGVRAGDPPSWSAAISFTTAYVAAVGEALLAALVISAAVQACLPPDWTARLFTRRNGLGAAAAGSALATPGMLCTCCAAPVAATLRRHGAPTSAVLAYWLANPLLNPAVLAFLLLVAPWQWSLVRVVFGVLLAVGAAALAARLVPATAPAVVGNDVPAPREWPMRFLRALTRTSITVLPEYLVVVMLLGATRGWLLSAVGTGPGVAAVLVAAVVGTLLVLPTAAEIPILQALALAGAPPAVIGALLITLPAVSAPGMAVLAAALGWRSTVVTALLVALGGVAAGGVLALL